MVTNIEYYLVNSQIEDNFRSTLEITINEESKHYWAIKSTILSRSSQI